MPLDILDSFKQFIISLSEAQATILRSILSPFQNSILNMARNATSMTSLLSRVNKKVEAGIFFSESNLAKMKQYLANVGKAVKKGAPKLAQPQMAKLLDMMKQGNLNQITKLDNDIRNVLQQRIRQAIADGTSPQQLATILEKDFNIHKTRAELIAHTETSRAGNMARHAKAATEGKKYFVVYPRPGACKFCWSKYEGEIFDITETLAIPPLHPRCKCVQFYFDTLDEAGKYATKIMDNNESFRKQLIKDGYNIPQDGTLPKKSKVPSIDQIDRAGPMTIPRSEFYKQQKLIYKKIRNPLMNTRFDMQNLNKKQWISDIKSGKVKPFNSNPIKMKEPKVMDLHIHTKASPDSEMSVKKAISEAKKAGLDGIAITDHNSMASVKEAMKYNTKSFTVIPGCEITTTKGHMLGLGINKPIRPGLSPRATAEAIRQQGGVVISPHSMSRYRDGIFAAGDRKARVDLMESKNSRYATGYSNNKTKAYAESNNIGQTGSSDSHKPFTIGTSVTQIEGKNGILTGLKEHKTNVYGSDIPLGKIIKKRVRK